MTEPHTNACRARRRSLWAVLPLLAAVSAGPPPAAGQLPGGDEDWAAMWSELYPEEASYAKRPPPAAAPERARARAGQRPPSAPAVPAGPRIPVIAYASPERVAEQMRRAQRAARLRRAARSDPGLWAGAVLGNIAYLPAKAAYAGSGALTAAVAWLVTPDDGRAARRLWAQAFGGHWMLTPERLAGVETLEFTGR